MTRLADMSDPIFVHISFYVWIIVEGAGGHWFGQPTKLAS